MTRATKLLSAVLGVSALLNGYLADLVVREENQRYALQNGSCGGGLSADLAKGTAHMFDTFHCLQTYQSRTGWSYHLFYAITDEVPPVPFELNWDAVLDHLRPAHEGAAVMDAAASLIALFALDVFAKVLTILGWLLAAIPWVIAGWIVLLGLLLAGVIVAGICWKDRRGVPMNAATNCSPGIAVFGLVCAASGRN